MERVVFKGDVQVDGWRAAVIIEAAKLDVAAARRQGLPLDRLHRDPLSDGVGLLPGPASPPGEGIEPA